MLTELQRKYLLPKAYNAAIRAGALILDIYEREGGYDVDLKSDMTPITIADRESHNMIKSYLGQTHIPILSEEGREMQYEERVGWDLFWLVDPLDGTKEFIKGNGEFTVNIALMSDNKPEISVIYVPYISRIYFCDSALGAFVSENVKADSTAEYTYDQIFCGYEKQLPLIDRINSPIRIATSRSHNNEATFEHINRLKEDFPDAIVLEQGSSFKLCMIAEGAVDYYVRTSNTYEWDTAAGQLLIEQAGGEIISLDGNPLKYNEEALINPHFVCRSKHMPKK